MQITAKGQITIPGYYRAKFHLLPHSEVHFEEINGLLCIIPEKKKGKKARGRRIIERMRSVKTNNMTTEEIMALTRKY